MAGSPLVCLGSTCEGRSRGICSVCGSSSPVYLPESKGAETDRRDVRLIGCVRIARVIRDCNYERFRCGRSGRNRHGEYLARQGAVITGYLLGLAIPLYSIDPPSPPTSLWFLWGAVLLLASIASRRFSGARAGFWVLGGMALLLPSSSIFPAADVVAFRRMYLPLLAFAVALAMYLPKQTWILALLAGVSIYRCYVWANPERVWREAVHRNAYGLRPYIQLARTVEPDEAIRLLERAKTINPDSPLVFSELGRAYLTSGEPGKALGEFGRALAMAPDNPQALSNRGVALLMLKQTAAAKSDFERALEIDPCAFEARLNAVRMGLHPAPAPQCRYSEEERKALLDQ